MKHYLTYSEPEHAGEGLVRQIFSSVPLRYLEGDKYRKVEAVLSDIGAGGFDMTRTPHKVLFPKKASGEIIYRNLSHEVSISALCDPVAGHLTEPNRAYYPDAFGSGCSLELVGGAGMLKKNVVIERKPHNPPEFRFEMRFKGVPAPLCDTLFGQGVSLGYSEDDCSFIRQGSASDAKGKHYHLPLFFRRERGRTYLVKRIPREVLESCVYPLRFDASISPLAHTADGMLSCNRTDFQTARAAATGTANSSATSHNMQAGLSGGLWYTDRMVMCFDTSALPDTLLATQITNAILNFYLINRTGASYVLNTCRSFQASPTALASGDYDAIGSDEIEAAGRAVYTPTIDYGYVILSSTGWKTQVFNASGKERISLVGYTQVGLRDRYEMINDPEEPARTAEIVSANYAAYEPYLEITYSTTIDLSNAGGGIGTAGKGHYASKCTGTTTTGTTGTTLIDSLANFVSANVGAGDVILNTTDVDTTTVVTRVSATQLTLTANASFGVGDAYRVEDPKERDRITIQNFASSMGGGVGIGGTCQEERSVAWIAQTAPFLIGTEVRNIVSVVASSTDTGFVADNLKYFNRPYRRWQATGTTAQTIDIVFDGGIDTLALINCNFQTFTITVLGQTTGAFTMTQDTDKEGAAYKYSFSGIALINTSGNAGKETASLRINISGAQGLSYGETKYRIGSVIGFKRAALLAYPLFPSSKKFIENAVTRDFEGGTQETETIGRPYMVMRYSFPRLTAAAFDVLQDVERLSDSGGYLFVSENYPTDVTPFYFKRLCQKIEDFSYSYVGRSIYSANIILREVI